MTMHTEENIKKIIRKEYSMLQKFYRFLKYHTLLILRKHDTPENIAHGMAIGIAVGFLPVIPFQALIALFFCAIFKKNKYAGVIGTNIFTNAILAIPVFYLIHFVGKIFIPVDISYQSLKAKFTNFSMSGIADFGLDLYLSIFIGGLVLAVIFYWPTYHLTKTMIIQHRHKRKRRAL